MEILTFHFESGTLLFKALQEKVTSAKIESGTILTVIGALKEVTFITMRAAAVVEPPANFTTTRQGWFELTGNGVIEEGKAHVHFVAGEPGGAAFAGHLVEGVVTHFVKVKILVET